MFLCRFGFVRLAGGDAAFYHQIILIVQAVGIGQGGLIVCVEELLLTQRLDLLIQPIQQGVLPLVTAGAMVSLPPSVGMPTT